jgi:carbon monoxide dehydrogenase subunit G
MQVFKKILLVLVIAVCLLLVFAATRPGTFHVERTTAIKAPPEKIFPMINNFHSWAAWSPYESLDPAMKKSFSGADSGPGAVYEWEGNSRAGKGRTEIVESIPASKIKLKLDMIKPIEGHNDVEFTLQPKGDTTNVTWGMSGHSSLMVKVVGIFMNMDRAVGSDFEKGLSNLKTIAEK